MPTSADQLSIPAHTGKGGGQKGIRPVCDAWEMALGVPVAWNLSVGVVGRWLLSVCSLFILCVFPCD